MDITAQGHASIDRASSIYNVRIAPKPSGVPVEPKELKLQGHATSVDMQKLADLTWNTGLVGLPLRPGKRNGSNLNVHRAL